MTSPLGSTALSALTERPANVDRALLKLHIARNIYLRRLFSFYPLIVAMVLVADWLFAKGTWMINNLPITFSYLAVALASLLFVRLYDQLPETLRALWDRGSLQTAAREPVSPEEYTRFVEQFDRNLNSIWSWVAGIAVMLVARLILLKSTVFAGADIIPILLGTLSYFMDGIALWKLVVVSFSVMRLSNHFNVAVQPAHPDGSGGLGPLGDLCFTNALILLGPMVYFAAWVVLASSASLFSGFPTFYQQAMVFKDLLDLGVFHAALIALVLLELVVFFVPLYEIHREMVRQASAHRQKLDALTLQIDQINQDLIASAQTLNPAEAKARLDTIQWIRQVYEDNDHAPTWPFNRSLILKLLTSQIIPLLSLTGLGKPILDAIGALANLAH